MVGFITHEEATIKMFMEDPEFAEYLLNDAIEEGDIEYISKIQRRIQEAKRRIEAQNSKEAVSA